MPQINEEQLKRYSGAVFDRCNFLNEYVLQTIGRRIKNIGRLSAYDEHTLKNLADISGDMKAITKKLAEITKMNVSDIEDIYTKVATEGVNSYKHLYDLKGMEFCPFEQNDFAQTLVKYWASETAEEMINLSRAKALCFNKYSLAGEVIDSIPIEKAYQKAIDDAVIAISTGTADFNTAMRKTIEQLGGSGIRVNYGNGVTRRFDSMVRQNPLYGAKRAAQAYDEYVGQELECNGFEVDYHPHPRPSHEFMGGEMYSYNGMVTIDGVTYQDGTEALNRLDDCGCLHFKLNVILGISEPRYDKKWLDEQKKKDKEQIEFNGIKKTKYGWQQVQRRLETEIRRQKDIKNMAEASGNNVLTKDCVDNIKAYRKKYDELCQKTGLEPQIERITTFGNNVNALTSEMNMDIIKTKRINLGVNDVHYVGKINKDIYKCITEDIKTDEVIITETQIRHIKDRHPNDYEQYYQYFADIVENPDFIIEANKPNTALILKNIHIEDKQFKTVLRLVTSDDAEEYKNSIITFMKIDDKEWKRLLKNKKVLYKRE